MSRQRIHQLIRLLDLPDEIKEDVRTGRLSERDTRIYQGLTIEQQGALHRARYQDDLSANEVTLIARSLKTDPAKSVSQAIIEVSRPLEIAENEQELDSSFESATDPAIRDLEDMPQKALRSQPWTEGTVLPARQGGPTSIDRLDWVRGHLARVQRRNLSQAERREIVRLLKLIEQDVASLLAALGEDDNVTA